MNVLLRKVEVESVQTIFYISSLEKKNIFGNKK